MDGQQRQLIQTPPLFPIFFNTSGGGGSPDNVLLQMNGQPLLQMNGADLLQMESA
jgi:hypothetical protein